MFVFVSGFRKALQNSTGLSKFPVVIFFLYEIILYSLFTVDKNIKIIIYKTNI